MNFFKVAVKSCLGASLAQAIYSSAVFFFLYGSVSAPVVAVYSLLFGTVFGILYALVYIEKPLSLLGSTIAGLVISLAILFALSIGEPLVEFSLFSLVSALCMGLALGLGAFFGVSVGKK